MKSENRLTMFSTGRGDTAHCFLELLGSRRLTQAIGRRFAPTPLGCSSEAVLSGQDAFILGMHAITRKRLNMFADKYPETQSALVHWHKVVKQHNFSSFAELRMHFLSADPVEKLTVFNIGGNKVRLIAAIHYNRRKLYIRAVLTHAGCDQGKWKE